MPIYRITGVVAVPAYTDVEAGTADEALQIAEQRSASPGLISEGVLPSGNFVVDCIDGVVTDLQVMPVGLDEAAQGGVMPAGADKEQTDKGG